MCSYFDLSAVGGINSTSVISSPCLLVQRMTPNGLNNQMKGGVGKFLLQASKRRVEAELPKVESDFKVLSAS